MDLIAVGPETSTETKIVVLSLTIAGQSVSIASRRSSTPAGQKYFKHARAPTYNSFVCDLDKADIACVLDATQRKKKLK